MERATAIDHFGELACNNTVPLVEVGIFGGVQVVCFLSSSMGKIQGLYVCGDTFVYIMPPANIFLTRLFSNTRLKRKDFQEIARLPWAQEAPGSNPGAPANHFFVFPQL